MRSILISIISLLFLLSCSTESSNLFEGKWQLQQVEEGNVTTKVDTVFYNFQSSLFMYQILYNNAERTMSSYGFKTLQGATLNLELTSYSQPVEQFITKTDWEKPIRSFTVEEINGKKLVLSDNGKRYIFRKF